MKTLLVIEIILIVLLLTSCGRGSNSPAMVDVTFQPYVDLFAKEAVAHGRTDVVTQGIEIYFGETHTPTERAFCYREFNHSRRIVVNPQWWAASRDQREALVFHELGHCALNLEHIDQVDGNGVAVSLMHSVLVSGTVYQEHRGEYLQGLFN